MRTLALLSLLTFVLGLAGCDSGVDEPEELNSPALNLNIQQSPTSSSGGPTVWFEYTVPVDSRTTLSFRRDSGEELKRLADAFQQSGQYTVLLESSTYTPGRYRFRLEVAPVDGSDVLVSTGRIRIQKYEPV